jgi:hypothetical protein
VADGPLSSTADALRALGMCEPGVQVALARYGDPPGATSWSLADQLAFLDDAVMRPAWGALVAAGVLPALSMAGQVLTGREWPGAGLAGADLAGAACDGINLEGADLTGANVAGASFAGARLAGSRWTGAALAGADFAGADVAGAAGLEPAPEPVPGPTLEEARAARCAAIDARTRELIALGFSVGGQTFSLSREAQAYWSGLGVLVTAGLLSPSDYPIRVNTLDDIGAHDIASDAEAMTFFAAAATTVKARLGSGTALKDAVRAAATVAAVEAVADER